MSTHPTSRTHHRHRLTPSSRPSFGAAALPALSLTAGALFLLAPTTTFALPRTWDGGATGTGTNWTASGGGNWNPDGVPTTADTLTLNNSIVTVPTSMMTTNDFGALSITFANGFNGSNTTVFGSSSTLTRTMTLGSTGNAWTFADNATSGSVTFQPINGGTVAMVSTLASSGTFSVPTSGVSVVYTINIGNTGGSYGINKTGLGNLTLGGTNTYAGGTTVSAGILNATANSALGAGDVEVFASSSLTLAAAVTNAVADTATLRLDGSGAGGGKLVLNGTNGTSQETVGALFLNGLQQAPGTYGATGSGASIIDDTHFTGTGYLTVVPEPSTDALLAAGAVAGSLLLVRRRGMRLAVR